MAEKRPYPSFLIYIDEANEYRWRYQAAGNHKILADSGEGYTTYKACLAGLEMVQNSWGPAVWRTQEAAHKKKQTG